MSSLGIHLRSWGFPYVSLMRIEQSHSLQQEPRQIFVKINYNYKLYTQLETTSSLCARGKNKSLIHLESTVSKTISRIQPWTEQMYIVWGFVSFTMPLCLPHTQQSWCFAKSVYLHVLSSFGNNKQSNTRVPWNVCKYIRSGKDNAKSECLSSTPLHHDVDKILVRESTRCVCFPPAFA